MNIIPLKSYADRNRPFGEIGFTIVDGGVSDDLRLNLEYDMFRLAGTMFGEPDFPYDPAAPDVFVNYISVQQSEHPKRFVKYMETVGDLRSFKTITHCPSIQTEVEAISCKEDLLLFSGTGGFFINKKGCAELQYRWHQEQAYYPNQDAGIHVWFPLFNAIEKTGGAMLLAAGSHKVVFPFSSSRAPRAYLQLDADFEPDKYSIVSADLSLGDVILFHHNTVHCTNPSTSSLPRISGLARFLAATTGNSFPV